MKFTVTEGQSGARIDLVVGKKTGLPRRRLAETFEAGRVRMNGRRAGKGRRTAAGDVIEVDEAALQPPAVAPDPSVRFAVIHEDGSLAVVEKPAGVPTHPNRAVERGTLANGLVARWPEIGAVGDRRLEPGLVHRLDTGTSGLMVVALSGAAFPGLRRAFASRGVEKEYVAVVEGRPPHRGAASLPIAHHARNARKMVVVESTDSPRRGKAWPAATEFETLRQGARTALVRVRTEGGVMHQIRVHLAHAGFPVVGDRLYGSTIPVPGSGRFMLHASRIAFTHPVTGKRLAFRSSMPEEFGAALRW